MKKQRYLPMSIMSLFLAYLRELSEDMFWASLEDFLVTRDDMLRGGGFDDKDIKANMEALNAVRRINS